MKTILSNFKPLFFFSLLLTAMTFTACDKDETVAPIKDDLVGTWDIQSYKVSGDEYIGLAIESASITFDAYVDEAGVFEQEVTFPDEEATSIVGEYTVDDAHSKVSMNYEGEIVLAKVEIFDGGNKLRWDGTQDGYPLVILATRR